MKLEITRRHLPPYDLYRSIQAFWLIVVSVGLGYGVENDVKAGEKWSFLLDEVIYACPIPPSGSCGRVTSRNSLELLEIELPNHYKINGSRTYLTRHPYEEQGYGILIDTEYVYTYAPDSGLFGDDSTFEGIQKMEKGLNLEYGVFVRNFKHKNFIRSDTVDSNGDSVISWFGRWGIGTYSFSRRYDYFKSSKRLKSFFKESNGGGFYTSRTSNYVYDSYEYNPNPIFKSKKRAQALNASRRSMPSFGYDLKGRRTENHRGLNLLNPVTFK